MMRVVMWLSAALIAAGTITALAPATLLDARVAVMSSGSVRLADAEGPWWRGRGVLSAQDGSWRVPLAWRASLGSLLQGTFEVTVSAPDGREVMPRGTFEVTETALRVRDVAVSLPPAAVVGASGSGALGSDALRLGGDVQVASESLELADSARGSLSIEWRNARVATGGASLDLGTVTARLTARGDALAGPVTNRDGDVRVSGEVVLGRRRSSGTLQLSPEATTPESTRRLLGAVGSAGPDGTVTLRFQAPPR